jgi:hypothetical protein
LETFAAASKHMNNILKNKLEYNYTLGILRSGLSRATSTLNVKISNIIWNSLHSYDYVLNTAVEEEEIPNKIRIL